MASTLLASTLLASTVWTIAVLTSTLLTSTVWTSAVLTSAVLTSTVLVAVDGRSRFGGAGPTELAEPSWPNRAGRTELIMALGSALRRREN